VTHSFEVNDQCLTKTKVGLNHFFVTILDTTVLPNNEATDPANLN